MQWPFADWGADVVVSGHAHTYERIMRDGIVYFVNGLGGSGRYGFGTPVEGSVVRLRDGWRPEGHGHDTSLTFDFFDVRGVLVDSYRLPKPPLAPPAAPTGLSASAVSVSRIDLAWSDAADNETGFEIERSPDGAAWAPLAHVGANVLAYHDDGLDDDTAYHYRVRARQRAGFSGLLERGECDHTPGSTRGTDQPERECRLGLAHRPGVE